MFKTTYMFNRTKRFWQFSIFYICYTNLFEMFTKSTLRSLWNWNRKQIKKVLELGPLLNLTKICTFIS